LKYLLDSNHAIAWLNGDAVLHSRLAAAGAAGDRFALSTTILGELYFGAFSSQRVAENVAKLSAFAAQLELYDFDATAAEEFGHIKSEQRLLGKPIPTADAQIAAAARVHGLTVLTNDSHFDLVGNLLVEDWLI
jgi:tRNA(fMet)-specific endonuclease VapC